MNAFFSRSIALISDYAREFRLRRDYARAQRVLDALPEHMRKDIGWPDREFDREALFAAKPGWDAETFLARTACPPLYWLDEAGPQRS